MISTQTLPELSVEGSVAPARNPIRSVTGTGGEPIVARIPALDGLRGIASLMVGVGHRARILRAGLDRPSRHDGGDHKRRRASAQAVCSDCAMAGRTSGIAGSSGG